MVMDLTGRRLGQLEAPSGVVIWPAEWGPGTYLLAPNGHGSSTTGALSHRKGARRLVIIDP